MSTVSMAYSPLQDKFVKAPAKPQMDLVGVDATMATVWMDRNTRNRKLNLTAVKRYARDIGAGEWSITGDAVRFSTTGVLLDGQNRLQAIITADREVETFVCWNLDEACQRNIDDQQKRTYAQHLQILGQTDVNAVGSVVRRVYLYRQGVYGQSMKDDPSKAQLDALLRDHPELADIARESAGIATTLRVAPSVIGTAYFLCWEVDAAGADEFFSSLRSGVGLRAQSPILVLRERLMRARDERISTSSAEVLAWVIKGWNAHREGRSISLIRHKASDAFPVPKAS